MFGYNAGSSPAKSTGGKLLSNKNHQLASQIGYDIAVSNFVLFLNPRYRGEKFTWDNLPSIVDKWVKLHVEMQGKNKRYLKEMQEVASSAAKYKLNWLMEESDLLSWVHQVKKVPNKTEVVDEDYGYSWCGLGLKKMIGAE
jgi:hypothetical protein